ncbi:MAG: hypothetical protein R3F43_22695 [bacterium]
MKNVAAFFSFALIACSPCRPSPPVTSTPTAAPSPSPRASPSASPPPAAPSAGRAAAAPSRHRPQPGRPRSSPR